MIITYNDDDDESSYDKKNATSHHNTTQHNNGLIRVFGKNNGNNNVITGIRLGMGQGNRCRGLDNNNINTILDYLMIQGKTSTLECAHQLGKLCVIREVLIVNLLPYYSCNNNDTSMSTDVDFIFHEFKTIMASYDVHCFIIQDKEIPPFSVTTNSAIQSFTTCYQEEEREENDNNHITTAIQEQNVENNQKKNDNSEPTRSRSSSITTANNNRNVWEFLQCVERESIKKRNRVQKLVRTHNRQHYQERRLRWEHSSCASGSTGERHRSSYYHSPIKSDEKESSTLATLLRIADDDNKTKNYDYTRRDIWKFLDKVKLETSRKKDRAYQLANNTDYCCYHHQPPPPPPDNSKAVGRLDAFLTSCCPWDKLRQITVTTVDSDSSSRRSSFSSFGSSSSFDEKEYLSSYYDGGSIESDNNSGSENGSNNTERSQIFSPSIIL